MASAAQMSTAAPKALPRDQANGRVEQSVGQHRDISGIVLAIAVERHDMSPAGPSRPAIDRRAAPQRQRMPDANKGLIGFRQIGKKCRSIVI